MAKDILFFTIESSVHEVLIEGAGFSIYPTSETYDALIAFQSIANLAIKLGHTCTTHYIKGHPSSDYGVGFYDMVSFIKIK